MAWICGISVFIVGIIVVMVVGFGVYSILKLGKDSDRWREP